MADDLYSMIAESCIEARRTWVDGEIAHFRGQPDLARAIDAAASCTQSDGKRHSHQYRIKRVALDEARLSLHAASAALEAAASFAELYDVIARAAGSVPGIGELTVYDVAVWIGWYLGLEPDAIYLHAGTRAGAEALGLDVARRSIPIEDLPEGLRRFAPGDLEDILCICKRQLAEARMGVPPDLASLSASCRPAKRAPRC